MSKKAARLAQFLENESGAYMHLSYPLIRCALSNLKLALQDRHEPVFRSMDNHYSYHGIGSIVLLVSGFDSLLNEMIVQIAKELKHLAAKPIATRYNAIAHRRKRREIPRNDDLHLLVEVRHEIVHGLPRVINEPSNVPMWLRDLQDRGLFITSPGSSGDDFALGWKIGSYKLCYWAWETVSAATKELLNTLDEGRQVVVKTVSELERFRDVCSPVGLVDFDKKHALEVRN